MLYIFGWLLLFTLPAALAGGLDADLPAFVQQAVPKGGILFSGAVQAAGTTYELFLLQQAQRRGVMVVTDIPAVHRHILFADTSLDIAADRGLIPLEVMEQFVSLLGIGRSLPNQPRTNAAGDDIYPIGAALNTVLGRIAGLILRSNSTLGILQQLEQSDAIPVAPAAAPAGSILICPTTYSATGPVWLGSVAVLGPDRKVYGPDFRKGGAWTSLGTLESWIEENGENHQLFGFLLKAHADRT